MITFAQINEKIDKGIVFTLDLVFGKFLLYVVFVTVSLFSIFFIIMIVVGTIIGLTMPGQAKTSIYLLPIAICISLFGIYVCWVFYSYSLKKIRQYDLTPDFLKSFGGFLFSLIKKKKITGEESKTEGNL